MNEKIDLSGYEDNEITDLYWALYDLNATLLKLISAGLATEAGGCDIDGTMKMLGSEIKLRRALRWAAGRNKPDDQQLVDKIGADF